MEHQLPRDNPSTPVRSGPAQASARLRHIEALLQAATSHEHPVHQSAIWIVPAFAMGAGLTTSCIIASELPDPPAIIGAVLCGWGTHTALRARSDWIVDIPTAALVACLSVGLAVNLSDLQTVFPLVALALSLIGVAACATRQAQAPRLANAGHWLVLATALCCAMLQADPR